MNIWLKRFFIIVSVGGGAVGFTAIVPQLFQDGHPVIYYVMYCVAIFLNTFGIYSGITFVENEKKGIDLLSQYFLFQIPILASPILSYQFTSGITAYLTLGSNGLLWGAHFGADWFFSLFQTEEKAALAGINFFALWANWFLRTKLRTRIREQ